MISRPVLRSVLADQLPAILQPLRRFVGWKLEWTEPKSGKPGKWTKVPYIATDCARKASSTNPTTWRSFDDALGAVEDGKVDGLGLVLGENGHVDIAGRIAAVDFDHCVDAAGNITPHIVEFIARVNSYTERSPTDGIRILAFVDALPPGGRKRGDFEMYNTGRYVTLTGQHVAGTPTELQERTGEIAALHAEIFGPPADVGLIQGVAERPASLDLDDRTGCENIGPDDLLPTVDHLSDDDLIALAEGAVNGAKFRTLWAGDVSGYPSQSEADSALCCLLAFWTQGNHARINRLFRRSGLGARDKWDRDDYRERTIAHAIEKTSNMYAPSERLIITEIPAPDPPTASIAEDVAPARYTFASAVGPDHFLAKWIDYASRRTDAAHEYHEGAGLALLAAATPNVRAQLAPYPNGLPTNLYALMLGDSTISRKTTSKDFARDVQTRALPGSLSADQFSPEGFVEQLAGRPHDSTTLYVDEFGEMLDKLHHAKHMAGLRGLLMTVYGGDDYSYRKHSKRKKGEGADKYEDEDRIVGPHLSILGATTPAAFDVLVEADVICGLLPRFAIIMPTSKPARKPFYEAGEYTEQQRNALVLWLAKLHAWAAGDDDLSTRAPRVVTFAPGVLDLLDQFAARLEKTSADRTDTAKAMLQRLPAMAVKLAMLIAAGQPATLERTSLAITIADADSAIRIATRWQGYAVAFAGRIGESDFERKLQRCARIISTRKSVPRSVVARLAHVDRKTLDNIRDTLADRAAITVGHVKAASGPATEIWHVRGEGQA